MITPEQIGSALQQVWNDWTLDTGTIPHCIKIYGPTTTRISASFENSLFAHRVASILNQHNRGVATFSQPNYKVEGAVDGDPQTGWGIHGGQGRNQSAVFVLREPLQTPENRRLMLRMDYFYRDGLHALGRFRISVTAHPDPASILDTP